MTIEACPNCRQEKDRAEYVVIYKKRECAHEGCDQVIGLYLIKRGTSEDQPVWCRSHKDEAWRK